MASRNAFKAGIWGSSGDIYDELSIIIQFTVTDHGALLSFDESHVFLGDSAPFYITDLSTGTIIYDSQDYREGGPGGEWQLNYVNDYLLEPGSYKFSNEFFPSSYGSLQNSTLTIIPLTVPEVSSVFLTAFGLVAFAYPCVKRIPRTTE